MHGERVSCASEKTTTWSVVRAMYAIVRMNREGSNSPLHPHTSTRLPTAIRRTSRRLAPKRRP
eukprot:260443-Prymnesium_polylepis.1